MSLKQSKVKFRRKIVKKPSEPKVLVPQNLMVKSKKSSRRTIEHSNRSLSNRSRSNRSNRSNHSKEILKQSIEEIRQRSSNLTRNPINIAAVPTVSMHSSL